VVDYVEEYSNLVKSVANIKAREYPMVPRQDIVQELWLWFAEHPNKIKEWHALENQKDSTKLFARALHNAASKYCQYEKARTSGYEVTDVFFYKREIVEELLASVLSDEWIIPSNDKDLNGDRAKKAPNEGGDLLALQADISKAFSKLKEDQQNILYLWYQSGRNSKDLSKLIQIPNERAARMRVTRAIDSIIRKLGGFAFYNDRDYKS
jgi:RNA polymerase sigma factor (sigma-70 family)